MSFSRLETHLCDADALIIVPPFAGLDRPALGAHVVQACARARGLDVRVLYANMLLAARIGEAEYGSICFASTSNLLGERFFAAAAYGPRPGLVEREQEGTRRNQRLVPAMGWDKFAEYAAAAPAFCDELAQAIAARRFVAVGLTTTFEQTAASIAIVNRLKQLRPELTTLLGGANCEGPMAEGILSLSPAVDFVFAGESEATFPPFLEALKQGERASERIIYGSPCRTLDAVPTPDFAEYYQQLTDFLPSTELRDGGAMWLPYESSRGCWWGEKSHCTFCGINGGGMVFRQKTPERVISELRQLLEKHPTRNVCMVDNIMPHEYFRTLLPRLATEVPDLHMFYEQKSNLTLERVRMLKAAGVGIIQPGIEALSTPLLKLMRKGVTAAQNIALLRFARMVDLAVNWNLLYAFPHDRSAWYEETATLMPALAHLNPPTGLCHLSIDRFSPYFEQAEQFGIREVRPIKPYLDLLPPGIDHHRIAYHFQGEYPSESKNNPALVQELERQLDAWRKCWQATEVGLPIFEIAPLSDELFMLADTRGLPGAAQFEFIDLPRALLALFGRTPQSEPQAIEWALARSACVELDGRLVPLATSSPELMEKLEPLVRGAARAQQRLVVLGSEIAADA